MNHWYDPMNLIMLIMTFVIAAGVLRSMRAGNKFAVAFGIVSLALFLFVDYLILAGV